MLIEKAAVSRRWTEYFERLLNLEEDGEPVIIPVVREKGVIVFELNETMMMEEEMQKSVKEITGKVAGLDGCMPECLKDGGATVTDWSARLLNLICE